MGITVAVTRVACPIVTGNFDVTTTDLGGLTPKAAYFIVSYATIDVVGLAAVAADHAMHYQRMRTA